MNILEKTKNSNGYLRIFSEEWNDDIKNYINENSFSQKIDLVEIPFSWGTLRYLYQKNHSCSEITTVMFKIPMNLIPYEELWSKWGKRRAKQLKEFIQAWVVKKNIKDKELMNLHTLYTYRYSIISVPKFLKSRLFSHLTAFGITFKEVSPEYHNIKCENCGTDFRFRTLGAIKKSSCPNCKSISFVR